MFIIPRKKVPVVSMTLLQWIISPDPIISINHVTTIHIRLPYLPRTTPVISGCSFPLFELNSMSSTESSHTIRVEYFFISSCMLARYWSLSICALNPHTAGPFFLFRTRYWIPDISAKRHCSKCVAHYISSINTPHTLPHSPSRASISLIKCPFPMPPNEGLHDISPERENKANIITR